jgi:hypothetical protein
MKTTVQLTFLTICLLVSNLTFSQVMSRFIESNGKAISELAHPSNIYISGTYEIHNGYVDISINSKDNITDFPVRTDIRLLMESGKLYFSDLIVTYDDDPWVKPFKALELIIITVTESLKALDQSNYILISIPILNTGMAKCGHCFFLMLNIMSIS